MDSDDAEYLHQMRVALRRLRVVLRMAEKNRADEQLAALSKEVAALCVALGEPANGCVHCPDGPADVRAHGWTYRLQLCWRTASASVMHVMPRFAVQCRHTSCST